MPRIIDDEVFARVQRILDKNKAGQELTAGRNDLIFNLVLLNNFFLTQMFLGVLAGVIMIYLAGLACTAVTDHHFTAIAAEQLGGQQIILLAPASCRSDDNIKRFAEAIDVVCRTKYDSSAVKHIKGAANTRVRVTSMRFVVVRILGL